MKIQHNVNIPVTPQMLVSLRHHFVKYMINYRYGRFATSHAVVGWIVAEDQGKDPDFSRLPQKCFCH